MLIATWTQPGLAAAAPASNLSDAAGLMVVGMAVVFSGLVLLMLAITLLNRIVGEDAPPPPTKAAPPAKPGQVDGRLIAVLAAAATAALHRPVQVQSVRKLTDAEPARVDPVAASRQPLL